MTHFMTHTIPLDLFDELAALTNKPIAITETGYQPDSRWPRNDRPLENESSCRCRSKALVGDDEAAPSRLCLINPL